MTTISVDGARANDRITGGTSQNFSSETVQEFQISTTGFDLSAGTVSQGAFIVLPDNFSSGDSFIAHDLRLTRVITMKEKIKLRLIAEGFNVLNIANLGGYSGSLASAAYIRPVANAAGVITTAGRSNPNNLFGQATSRVSPIFGTGGPRAFQFAARLSF